MEAAGVEVFTGGRWSAYIDLPPDILGSCRRRWRWRQCSPAFKASNFVSFPFLTANFPALHSATTKESGTCANHFNRHWAADEECHISRRTEVDLGRRRGFKDQNRKLLAPRTRRNSLVLTTPLPFLSLLAFKEMLLTARLRLIDLAGTY